MGTVCIFNVFLLLGLQTGIKNGMINKIHLSKISDGKESC